MKKIAFGFILLALYKLTNFTIENANLIIIIIAYIIIIIVLFVKMFNTKAVLMHSQLERVG